MTTATLQPIKTKQGILNHVRQHLSNQGRKAMNGNKNVCRAADGCQCAVGCLIPDHLYRPSMESQMFLAWIPDFEPVVAFHGWVDDTVAFVRSLQIIHDTCEAAEWAEKFDTVAVNYGLERGW